MTVPGRRKPCVVAATDGSAASMRAMERAVTTAKRCGGEVVAVHVMSSLAAFLSSVPDSSFARTGHRLHEILDEIWTAPARQAGVPYRTRLVSGSPVQQLMAIAAEEGADCIVAGLTGRDAGERTTIGTTALALTRQTDHKVVLVPPEPFAALAAMHPARALGGE